VTRGTRVFVRMMEVSVTYQKQQVHENKTPPHFRARAFLQTTFLAEA